MAEIRNVKWERKGNILTVTVDLDKNLGLSASEKSTLIASTGGGQPLAPGDPISINLSVYKKVKSKK